MSAEADVREASARFYAALNRMIGGEAGAMTDVWSHDENVTTMHPIGGREVGWNEVANSFDGVAGIASPGGQVRLADQRIELGEDLAYEVGTELGHATLAGERVDIEWRVTNVYRRENGTWKIVHHHTDASRAMQQILERLQAGS